MPSQDWRVYPTPPNPSHTPPAGVENQNAPPRGSARFTGRPGGHGTPACVEAVRGLLSLETGAPAGIAPPASTASGATPASRQPVRASSWSKPALLAVVALLAVALAYSVADKFWSSKHAREAPPVTSSAPAAAATTTAAAAAFSPPPHSIAVLPFVNMSGDKGQQYFSDGLTEELLNSLSRINELQVSARTSSFSRSEERRVGKECRSRWSPDH